MPDAAKRNNQGRVKPAFCVYKAGNCCRCFLVITEKMQKIQLSHKKMTTNNPNQLILWSQWRDSNPRPTDYEF